MILKSRPLVFSKVNSTNFAFYVGGSFTVNPKLIDIDKIGNEHYLYIAEYHYHNILSGESHTVDLGEFPTEQKAENACQEHAYQILSGYCEESIYDE